MKSPLIFRVFKNNQLHEVKQFDSEQVVLGNNDEAGILLEDDAVSSIHALIELRGDVFYVCDLGSTTGTMKNSQPILDEAIHSGDELQIGPFRILFYVGIPKPAAKPILAAPPPATAEAQPPTVLVAPIIAQPSVVATPPPTAEEKPPAALVTPIIAPPQTTPAVAPQAPAPQQPAPAIKPSVPTENEAQKIKEEVAVVIAPIPVVTSPQRSESKPQLRSPHTSLTTSKKGPTFAPPSHVKDMRTFLKPTKGNSIQVLVCWKERILTTYQVKLGQAGEVGRKEGKIALPEAFGNQGFKIVETHPITIVNVPPGVQAELITQQGSAPTSESMIKLQQGEMVVLRSSSSPMEVYIRFVPASRESLFVPPFFLSSGELSGLLASIIIAVIFAVYISATTPRDLNQTEEEDITRTAQIIFNENKPPPKPPTPPPPPPPQQVEAPPPPPEPPKAKPKVVEDAKTKAPQVRGTGARAQGAQAQARAAEVAPIPNSQNRPKKFTAAKSGGAVKLGAEAGANAQSAQKDVSKIGLFSALSTGGIRNKLDQAYSGSGEALGDADKATGSSGMGENRAGDDLGSRFKEVGRGGQGVSTQGIADIGIKGRSTGQGMKGTTFGIGDRDAVKIEAGGREENFVGTINKEHVRRVVRAGIPAMRGCYDGITATMSSVERRQFVGKVVLTWDIVAKGRAENVRVRSSTINNDELETCIKNRLAGWTFPEPPGDLTAEVSYPFIFKPAE